jgi:hypothetical protein
MLETLQSTIINRQSSMGHPWGHSMCNVYLVLAYGLLWGIFTFYAWVIHGRQRRLEKELAELGRDLGQP